MDYLHIGDRRSIPVPTTPPHPIPLYTSPPLPSRNTVPLYTWRSSKTLTVHVGTNHFCVTVEDLFVMVYAWSFPLPFNPSPGKEKSLHRVTPIKSLFYSEWNQSQNVTLDLNKRIGETQGHTRDLEWIVRMNLTLSVLFSYIFLYDSTKVTMCLHSQPTIQE